MEGAMSLLKSGQWCHTWEYPKHTFKHKEELMDMIPSSTLFSHLPFPPLPHQKSDSPAGCDISIHHQLVASLPLEEEPSGGSVWQTGLVVSHQVPAHKPTMVPRVQSGIQQEGIILRTDRHTDQML